MPDRKSQSMKAGKLLSKFIRQIAEEETELIKGEDGEDRMATKAEALAHIVWQKALGYKEVKMPGDGGPPVEIEHASDQKMIQLLWDRMEGRAPTAGEDTSQRPTTAQKVSEQGKNRIGAAGQLDD